MTSPSSGAAAEREPPAHVGVEHVGIEQPRRTASAPPRRADPEAAVDGEVDAAAQARRDQFLDRRVDGRVFAADARAGQEAEQQEAVEVPGEGRGRRRDEIDTRASTLKSFLRPSRSVRCPKNRRAQHGAREIGAARQADLLGGELEARAGLQRRRHRARQGDLEAVENPGDAEGDHDQPVKAAPREAVETGGNIGLHRRCNASARRSVLSSPCLQLRKAGLPRRRWRRRGLPLKVAA